MQFSNAYWQTLRIIERKKINMISCCTLEMQRQTCFSCHLNLPIVIWSDYVRLFGFVVF